MERIQRNITTDVESLRRLLQSNKNRVFGVTFEKKNGKNRVMACRMNKDGKGNYLTTYNPVEKQMMLVWSMNDQSYRNLPLDRLKVIRMNNVQYNVTVKQKA